MVADTVERLSKTSTVVAADFRGLTVAQVAELRSKLRDADAEMTVVKNTLSRRAVDESGHSALLPYLTGPTGLVWVNGDPAGAAKVLSDFGKAHDVFSVRGGMLDGADLNEASLKQLASLPSRDVLLSQLAGAVAAPLTGLAGGLQALISTMARTLSAVASSGQLAAGEAPVEAAPAVEEAPAAEAAVDEAPAAEAVADEAPAEAPTTDEAAPAADDAPADAAAEGDAGDGEAETPES